MNWKSLLHLLRGTSALLVLLVFAGELCAHATPISVINGNFEDTKINASAGFGDLYPSQQVTGWTTSGYNFVFLPGTADTTGATGQYGNLKLWGPGDGSNNGLTSSPTGGNFLAMDGAFEQGAVSQTLTGLTVGTTTKVSFYFAGAQQYGYTGATTEQFKVSLGDQSVYTPVLNDPSQGFTGWQYQTLSFTPTSTSEILSFLAIGTPGGQPPMSLLDAVSVDSAPTVSAVPEPSSLVLLLTGCVGGAGALRMRSRKGAKPA